jgi:hypothetical protein
VSNISTWSNGDAIPTNYRGHPMMAISAYFQVVNGPGGSGSSLTSKPNIIGRAG